MPVSPSTTRSLRPPTAVATTGLPYAIASRHVTPNPSRRDGHATTAAPAYSRSSSGRGTGPLAWGIRFRSGPSPTTTSGSPRPASASSSTPFSLDSRPAYKICGGSVSRPGSAGSSTPFGMTRTSSAPSLWAASAMADETATTTRARFTIARANAGSRSARAMSVPCSVTTNGRSVRAATQAAGNQCACTTSASRAASRAACTNEPSIIGTSAPSHGLRFRFPSTP